MYRWHYRMCFYRYKNTAVWNTFCAPWVYNFSLASSFLFSGFCQVWCSLYRIPAIKYLLKVLGKLADQGQLSKMPQGQLPLQPSSTLQRHFFYLQPQPQILSPWWNQTVLVRVRSQCRHWEIGFIPLPPHGCTIPTVVMIFPSQVRYHPLHLLLSNSCWLCRI